MDRLLYCVFIQGTVFLMFFVMHPIALMDVDNLNACREEFIYFENYCYYFASERQIFTIAKEKCNNYSLSQSNLCHLTSIHSAEENTFIRGNAQRRWGENSFWLGATKEDSVQNEYSWLDGSPMYFADFKPNPKPGTCLQWPGKPSGWNGANCSFKKYFVCKTKAVTPYSVAIYSGTQRH